MRANEPAQRHVWVLGWCVVLLLATLGVRLSWRTSSALPPRLHDESLVTMQAACVSHAARYEDGLSPETHIDAPGADAQYMWLWPAPRYVSLALDAMASATGVREIVVVDAPFLVSLRDGKRPGAPEARRSSFSPQGASDALRTLGRLCAALRPAGGAVRWTDTLGLTGNGSASVSLRSLRRLDVIWHGSQLYGPLDGAALDELGAQGTASMNNTAEGYELELEGAAVRVNVSSWLGLNRALATLQQLVLFDASLARLVLTPSQRSDRLVVRDQPSYGWRGVMVDTARHFFSPAVLMRLIDGLAATKMNALGWHISDAESFPLVLPSGDGGPAMHAGAFAPSMRYAPEAVRAIVRYAAERGVRVVPEIDMPAHVWAWAAGARLHGPSSVSSSPSDAEVAQAEGVLCWCPRTAKAKGKNWRSFLMLNLAHNATLPLVHAILDALAELFGDPFIHLGGDETDARCWDESPAMSGWLAEQKLTAGAAMLRFEKDLLAQARTRGRRVVLWQEAFDALGAGLGEHVLQAWQCWGKPTAGVRSAGAALAAGLSVLQSTCWYLDWDSHWQAYYDGAALEARGHALGAARVLGGLAALWAERVDWENIECRVWPRAAAAAERLWRGADAPRLSTSDSATVAALTARLAAARQQLAALGLRPALLGAQLTRDACPLDERIGQLNVDAGGGSDGRFDALVDWVRKGEFSVLGLCELNGWQRRAGGMAAIAGRAGFAYSVLMEGGEGYNLGLMSLWPVAVLGRHREGFERGVLHVLTGGMHVFVVHLNAHDAALRRDEAARLVDIMRADVPDFAHAPVLVLGDFNTLAPQDAQRCNYTRLERLLSGSPAYERLASKLLAADGRVDYRPFETLVGAGLSDLLPASEACPYTEPTGVAIDQLASSAAAALPPMRVDFMLGNEAFVARRPGIACAVSRDRVTAQLSDHYPSSCVFSRYDSRRSASDAP